jgi:two-component system NarL family sensor kinase
VSDIDPARPSKTRSRKARGTRLSGKRATSEAAGWKNRYEAAIRACGQILYDWDVTTGDIIWEGDCERILGYSVEELAGGRAVWMELVHPDDRSAVQTEIDRVVGTRAPAHSEYRVRTKSGRYLLIKDRGYSYADHHGKLSRIAGFITDITEQKRAEEELRASEERFRHAFAHAATGMFVTNLEGRFLEVNRAFCEITGYTEEELTATDYRAITHAEDLPRNIHLIRRMLAGEIPSFVIEKRYVRKDGTVVWARGSVSLLRDSKHNPTHMIALVEDISERKQAEEALRQLSGRLLQLQDEERRRLARELHDSTAQTMAALGINLGIVSNSADALDLPAQKALHESLDLADQCIRELRTFSYLLHPPVLDDLGLSSALEGYVEGFAKRSGIAVELDIPPDLGRLPEEVELMLFRIVQESLTNIHRHSGSRTAVIRIARYAREVLMQVQDHGRGIPGSLKPGEGTRADLGVGIVGMRERVRQIGGRLEIRSRPGGTDIEVLVPLSGL